MALVCRCKRHALPLRHTPMFTACAARFQCCELGSAQCSAPLTPSARHAQRRRCTAVRQGSRLDLLAHATTKQGGICFSEKRGRAPPKSEPHGDRRTARLNHAPMRRPHAGRNDLNQQPNTERQGHRVSATAEYSFTESSDWLGNRRRRTPADRNQLCTALLAQRGHKLGELRAVLVCLMVHDSATRNVRRGGGRLRPRRPAVGSPNGDGN